MKKITGILLCILVATAAVFGGFLLVRNSGSHETVRITLRGDREVFTGFNRPYAEMGAYAEVEKDGKTEALPVQITGQPVDTGRLGTYLLKYTAASGKHVVTAYRRVQVVDMKAPTINLRGAENCRIYVGQPYYEFGFVATDSQGNDLTSDVCVTGQVDRFNAGEYELMYTVTDRYKNTASVCRRVFVEEWSDESIEAPYFGNPNGKVIYLTFDDGPGKHTPRLLDVLKKYNVKATFFVVKTGYIKTAKRIAEEGHTLALHTTSHVYKEIYASEDAYFADLYAIQKIVKDLTGQESRILRFPGGSSNKSSSFNPGIMTRLTKQVEEKGFTYYDWTIDSKDSVGAKTAQEVFCNVTNGVLNAQRNYSIVLQHDIKSYSVDAVEMIIRWGLRNGYTFLPMDENTPIYHHPVRN